MTIEEIIFDVMEIKGAIEDDRELDETWLLMKINDYRAILINQQYSLYPVIDPAWLQSIPMFDFTKTDAADDPSITVNSITLGRAICPSVVSLPDDLGFNRLSGSGGIISFEPTDFDTLIMKALVKEEIHRNYGYYARVGQYIYVFPYVMEGKAVIIAEDPTDIQILDAGVYRDQVASDPYPLDAKTAQAVILQILTNDLKLNDQAITDIVNDAQTSLKIMKDVPAVQKKG